MPPQKPDSTRKQGELFTAETPPEGPENRGTGKTGDYELRTASGHPLMEAVSALQKMIRRGKEMEAVYWAREMEKGYAPYLWRRLLTIATEDIGMGDPFAIVHCVACREAYNILVKESRSPPDLHLIACVLYMCRAKKSRETDILGSIVWAKVGRGDKMPIPDCALDMHTKRGRSMGRTEEHFWKNSCKLHPVAPDQKWTKYDKNNLPEFPKDEPDEP